MPALPHTHFNPVGRLCEFVHVTDEALARAFHFHTNNAAILHVKPMLPLRHLPKGLTVDYPQTVVDITNAAAKKHASDIDAAVDDAEKRIRKLDEFEDIVGILVRSAVQELIHRARHTNNVAMRREARYYGQPAKVVVGSSTSVLSAATSVYGYYIAGTVLGAIKGADLASIAESERASASGHEFNAVLCSRLSVMVPADKAVRDAVSEKKLKALFAELQQAKGKEAA